MLPSSEKTPILVLQWKQKALSASEKQTSSIIPLVKEELRKAKFIILPSRLQNDAPDVLLLTATQSTLEEEAEKIFLIKERTIRPPPPPPPVTTPRSSEEEEETIMDIFKRENRSQFIVKDKKNHKEKHNNIVTEILKDYLLSMKGVI